MKELPILFNTPMVRAILDGPKTVTRRVMKPQPPDDYGAIEVGTYHPTKVDRHGEAYPGDPVFGAFTDDGEWGLRCPYGQPGDRLYVREAFGTVRMHELGQHTYTGNPVPDRDMIVYRAGRLVRSSEDAPPDFDQAHWPTRWRDDPLPDDGRWKPSIHMPKRHARIWLEVTEVSAEPVQEISEEDAVAEGVELRYCCDGFGGSPTPSRGCMGKPIDDPRMVFRDLWNEINGPRGYSFESNPWVWVVRSRKVSP